MVRPLIHDPLLLARVSQPATQADLPAAQDLLDTLAAHRETCVGMAGNMIGVYKRIIVFDDNGRDTVLFNPEILSAQGPFQTRESCLSLLGGPRECCRYSKIKVKYHNAQFQTRIKTYTGWTAQIIQHEIDHCNGILI